ncbi:hypothetical protein ACXXDI_13080 [Deinococcus sp. PESE-13]
MPVFCLEYAGKQYHSEKAQRYAVDLALRLRGHHNSGVSTSRLSKYYTIDSLKAAAYAVQKGYTLEVEKPPFW